MQRSNIENPRKIPLTTVWKKELIAERMRLERKRGFGKGVVLDRLIEDVTEKVVSKEGDGGACSSDATKPMKVFELQLLPLLCIIT